MGRGSTVFSYFNDWISSLGKFCSLTDWPRYPVRPSQRLFPLFWPELCSHKRGGCVGLAPGYIWTSGVGLSSLPRTLRPAVWEWQDLWAGLPFCPEVGDRAGSVFSADICCRFLEAAFPPPDAEELTLTTGKNMVQGK